MAEARPAEIPRTPLKPRHPFCGKHPMLFIRLRSRSGLRPVQLEAWLFVVGG